MDKLFNDPMVGYGVATAFGLGILIGGIFFSKYRWEKNIREKDKDEDRGIF